MKPKEIIAKAVEPHFDKPHHNLMAHEIVRALGAGGFVIVPKEPTPGMLEQAAHNLADEYGAEETLRLKKFALDAWGEFINAGQVR